MSEDTAPPIGANITALTQWANHTETVTLPDLDARMDGIHDRLSDAELGLAHQDQFFGDELDLTNADLGGLRVDVDILEDALVALYDAIQVAQSAARSYTDNKVAGAIESLETSIDNLTLYLTSTGAGTLNAKLDEFFDSKVPSLVQSGEATLAQILALYSQILGWHQDITDVADELLVELLPEQQATIDALQSSTNSAKNTLDSLTTGFTAPTLAHAFDDAEAKITQIAYTKNEVDGALTELVEGDLADAVSAAVIAKNEAVSAKNDAEGSAADAVTYATIATNAKNDAGDYASAAASSASTASSKATDAATQATAAMTHASNAQTARSESEGYATTAATAKDDAETAAALSEAHLGAVARITSGGVSKNPIFTNWPLTILVGYSIETGVGAAINKITTDVRYVNALELKREAVAADADMPAVYLARDAHGLDCSDHPVSVKIRMELEYVSGDLAASGARLLARWQDSGVPREVSIPLTELINPTTGSVQVVERVIRRPSEWVGTGAQDFELWLYAASTSHSGTRGPICIRAHRFDFEEVLASSETELYQRAVADLTGLQHTMIGLRAQAGSGGALLELVSMATPDGDASSAKMEADEILLNGSVHAPMLTVDGPLVIQGYGYLSAYKLTPNDEKDGIWFGQSSDGAGGTRFALAASRTDVSGEMQEISFTNDGFTLTNPSFLKMGGSVPEERYATSNVTAEALSDNAVLAKRIKIVLGLGGGGGGASSMAYSWGANGEATTIYLYDGSTLKMMIVCPVGQGATDGSNHSYLWPGESTAVGVGGVAGLSNGGIGGNGTGYGSGGGGGGDGFGKPGRGGHAAPAVSTDWIDISGWTDPKISVVIGSGGAGGPGVISRPRGGDGAPGYVHYQLGYDGLNRADVVPLAPTTIGTFAKGTGAGSFPDLGPGFWEIWAISADNLQLEGVVLSPGDSQTYYSNRHASFYASQRPTYIAYGAARTIGFTHRRMGS